ncbi:MAG: glycosyl hydrolase family 18 protein [Candidatus Zixiibacteriota bacterium]
MKRTLLIIFLVFAAYGQSAHLEHIRQFGKMDFNHGAADRTPKRAVELSHEVYGFVPYWEDDYSCPRFDLISRLCYFNFTVNSSGNVTNTHNWYSASVVDDALAAGVPVDLCIALFDASSIDALVGSSANRGNCISNAIDGMLARGGSGINIDFELPSGSSAANVVTFCREFRDSLDVRAPGSWLSICLPPVDWSDAFDVDQLALYCDALFIMGYGYHYSGSATTGPIDPLDDPLESFDLAWSVNDYGSDPYTKSKLIMGLPLYGQSWSCDGSERGASTYGHDGAVFYRTAIANSETYGRQWDANSPGPWYRYSDGTWHQCWYSDSMSFDARYEFAKDHGLLGIGWWALGYDDGDASFWGGVEYCFAGGPSPVDTSDTIIVDDGEAGFTQSSGWSSGSYAPENGFRGDYDFCNAGGDINFATWTPDLPYDGTYFVYMWWLAGSNRCNNVPVSINGTDLDAIAISQQGSGAEWHYLGEYAFDAGSSGYVRISDDGATDGSVVIADAVMWILNERLDIDSDMTAKPDNLQIIAAPNPFNSAISISAEGFNTDSRFAIYDISGKVVDEFILDDESSPYIWRPDDKIDSGVYFIRNLSDNEGLTKIIFVK